MSREQRTPRGSATGHVAIKSKFDAEFRRFGLPLSSTDRFHNFYRLLQSVHRLQGLDVLVTYVDVYGDLLPINNDENFRRAVSTVGPLLRVVLHRKDVMESAFSVETLQRKKKGPHSLPVIGPPLNFRQVSSIIDVDILPVTHLRVRLHKHGSDRPLGFYIRDGISMRVTQQGVEKVPGVFISRVVRGGLAESTGLLGLNDEILEVNGIDVAGKSLDQVTHMMVANSNNLVITVKPANQRNNMMRGATSGSGHNSTPGHAPASQPHGKGSGAEGESDEEEEDIVIESDSLSPHLPMAT
ncbi:hypothetical protein GN956_G22525 [Arapaima gigas]